MIDLIPLVTEKMSPHDISLYNTFAYLPVVQLIFFIWKTLFTKYRSYNRKFCATLPPRLMNSSPVRAPSPTLPDIPEMCHQIGKVIYVRWQLWYTYTIRIDGYTTCWNNLYILFLIFRYTNSYLFQSTLAYLITLCAFRRHSSYSQTYSIDIIHTLFELDRLVAFLRATRFRLMEEYTRMEWHWDGICIVFFSV